MRPSKQDAARLWDMMRAAEDIALFIHGKDLDEYRTDYLLKAAVERKIEIIGEAARKVSDEFQCAHPEVPWRPIMAQRHVLAHDYGDIIDEKIWRVAAIHVPDLMTQLGPLIPPPPPGPDAEAKGP